LQYQNNFLVLLYLWFYLCATWTNGSTNNLPPLTYFGPRPVHIPAKLFKNYPF
jgi:hypothetical protein